MSSAIASPDQLLQQLNWRYATKQFDSSRKIPDAIWDALAQSLVLAPSSFGLQPWKFFVVQDPDTRQLIKENAWGQSQVVDASHLVVLARKNEITDEDVDLYNQRIAEVRQVPLESLEGFGKVIKGFINQPPYPLDLKEWATRQVYIALGQFMTSAAVLGIDTCPIEGFNPAKVDEILQLPALGYSSAVLCPAGYRAETDKYAALPKVRFPQESVIQYF